MLKAGVAEGRRLESISMAEIFSHFKIRPDHWSYYLLRGLLWLPAQKFGKVAAYFDQQVGMVGLHRATRAIRHHFITHLEAFGEQHIPAEGPLLVVSNHPGAADIVALMSTIPRPDLNIVAGDRPLLRALTNTSRNLILVDNRVTSRMASLRAILHALKDGKAVLIYPGGSIEPDPALQTGALDSLKSWSRSLGVFLSRAPFIQLLPAVVSGVFSPQAWRNPLTRLGRTVRERQQIAMIFQAAVQQVFPNLWPVTTQVHFAPPVTPQQLDAGLNPDKLYQAVLAYIHEVMATVS